MDTIAVPILLLRLFPVLIWIATGVLAWRRRRAMLVLGFIGAGLNSIPSALVYAGADLPLWVNLASSTIATPIVALICASFIANQDRDRPARWTP